MEELKSKLKKSSSEIIKTVKCEICDKIFEADQYLKRHIKTIHVDQAQYQCSNCGKRRNRLDNFKLHKCKAEKRPPKAHKCNLCGKSLSRSDHLKDHMVNVHQDSGANYKCHVCAKPFGNNETLKRHKSKEHAMGPQFKCDICGSKSFTRADSLLRHIQNVHEKQKHAHEGKNAIKHQCNSCDKSCTQIIPSLLLRCLHGLHLCL